MTHGPLPDDDVPLRCHFCGQVIVRIAVTEGGELIGCEACALERGLTPTVLTRAEWDAHDATQEALSHFDLHEPRTSKPPQDEYGEPRAHVWWVAADDNWYVLKRYYPLLGREAVDYEHSVLRYVAKRGQPVSVPMTGDRGETIVSSGDALWGLYPALAGQAVTPRDWMWRAPKAAECLAQLHKAQEECVPAGKVYPEWEAWTAERLENLVDGWPYVSEVGDGLVEAVCDHLLQRYFGEAEGVLPQQVVHGEFTPSNVLWRGDQLAGIVDFERAHRDTVLFDFAAGLASRHPPLLRAVLATYTRVRQLSEAERHFLPEVMLLGGLLGLHQQMVVKGDYDEAGRRAADLEYLLRDIEVVRRAVATR
jgi:Ser/Thr protein kinase RdoA (MazF antagonist)